MLAGLLKKEKLEEKFFCPLDSKPNILYLEKVVTAICGIVRYQNLANSLK